MKEVQGPQGRGRRTSFLVTGFSIKVKCVNLGKFPNESKSANSATLFAVRTSVVRFGSDEASVGWICLMRLRARSSVWRRGNSGKFANDEISLSVKSIASWSCNRQHRRRNVTARETQRGTNPPWQCPNSQSPGSCALYVSNANMISIKLISKCSICSFQVM